MGATRTTGRQTSNGSFGAIWNPRSMTEKGAFRLQSRLIDGGHLGFSTGHLAFAEDQWM